jgi:hypothetical protein
MKLKLLLIVAISALVIAAIPQSAGAQVVSEIDTFKVVGTTIAPGEIGGVDLFVVNDSVNLAAISAYIKIDNSVLEWVGEWDSLTSPPTFYVKYDTLPRAQIPNLFATYSPLVMLTNETAAGTIFGALVGAGSDASIPTGRGSIIRFYVKVKDDVPIGTSTIIRPFDPVDDPPHDDPRTSQYADVTGLLTVYPTLVPGTVEVDTGGGGPVENTNPVINTPSQSSYTVQPGTGVTFSISAYDSDTPAQTITLTATSLPSGATFGSGGSVSGSASVSGTFSWTPTASQVGTYVVTFVCSDSEGGAATPRSVTIVVQSSGNVDVDLLFTASSPSFGFPSGGIPGLSDVAIPVNLQDLQDVYGVQFDFLYQTGVMVVDSIVPTDRLTDFTIYDDLGANPGSIRIVAFGLNNQKIQSGATSAILDFWVTVKSAAMVGESPIRFENAWESISPNPGFPSVELEFDTTGVFVVDSKGDVNGDQRVDVADVVNVVGYIIGDNSLNHRQFFAADMDLNASVDVTDLVDIINTIFGGAAPVSGMYVGPLAHITLQGSDGQDYVRDKVQVNADLPTDVAGVQLEISYDPEKVQFADPEKAAMADNLVFRYRDNDRGKMTLLLYPGSKNASITAGDGVLLDLPLTGRNGVSLADGDIKIDNVVLSDRSASKVPVDGFDSVNLPKDFTLEQNYPNPFNPTTTIEFSIGASSAAQPVQLEIYNVLGAKVKTLVSGSQAVGVHRVNWDGTNDYGQHVASGVYFYRLQVGTVTESKKMLLMK